jgi:hemolysin activation/secretion protein
MIFYKKEEDKNNTMRFIYHTTIYLIISLACVLSSTITTAEDNSSAPLLMADTMHPQRDTGRLSEKPGVFVKRFRIIGSTKFSEEELAAVTASYENREITFEELQALRNELTQYYIDRGHINSGVIIPDQEIVDGIITLRVNEGIISGIEIEGNRHFRSSYFKKRLEQASKSPVDINNIQQALQVLQQDPRIRRINAELSPGISPGEAVLKVNVEEENPYKVALTLSNSQPPSVGSYKGELNLAHRNLFGFGDIMEGKFGLTEGTEEYSISYSIPVTAHDTMLKGYYRKSDSTVVEETFKRLDIESKSETFGIAVSHSFYKTPTRELNLALASEVRRNATFLLGRPYSFSELDDNVTHVTALRFSQEFINRSQTAVLAIRSNFSFGVNAFNATKTDSGADGSFISWTGQIQLIKQFSERGLQLVFRSDIQLANDQLLPMEKFPVGGMNSVRGYRENLLVRDNGVSSSLELRVPVILNKQGEAVVHLAPFVDFGWAWNTEKETPDPKSISSIGLGLRWAISKNALFQIYAGYPLRSIDFTDKDLQDIGLHFQLSWQIL